MLDNFSFQASVLLHIAAFETKMIYQNSVELSNNKIISKHSNSNKITTSCARQIII